MRSLLLTLGLASVAFTAEPRLDKQPLFQAGEHGYATYRIPGIVATDAGTLFAYCEARRTLAGDWGQIDIFARRSTDGGTTWEPSRKLIDIGPGLEKNPVALRQKLAKSNEITTNNPVAIADGDTIHFLYCVEYMRCFYCQSRDEGKTFSRPIEITSAFDAFRKEYDWKVLATGPGHGLRLAKAGRLIVPVWLSTGEGGHAHRPSCVATIFSDDRGKTWKRGDIVSRHPELTNPSEAAVVERADGQVLINIRHESGSGRRAWSASPDGAMAWGKPQIHADLPEPVCMGSLTRYDAKRLLFSNPHNEGSRDRRNVSVHVSTDDGKTWPHRRALESGLSGYSDLAVGKGGTAYCLYERAGIGHNPNMIRSIVMARFNEAWLMARPVRVITLGDSITKGFRPAVDDDETFSALLERDLRKAGLNVDILNVGIGGENTTQAKARLKAQVIAARPDVVTVMYGANDSYTDPGKKGPRVPLGEYRTNLESIVSDLQKSGIRVIVMTTNRYDAGHPADGSGGHPNKAMDLYMAACREVARARQVPLVDHQAIWIEAERNGTDIAKWMTDHVHPNVRGHQEMAKAMEAVVVAEVKRVPR